MVERKYKLKQALDNRERMREIIWYIIGKHLENDDYHYFKQEDEVLNICVVYRFSHIDGVWTSDCGHYTLMTGPTCNVYKDGKWFLDGGSITMTLSKLRCMDLI